MNRRKHAIEARDLVAGLRRDDQEQLAEALEGLRDELLAAPSDEVAATHLAAMVEVADAGPAPAAPASRSLSWGQRTRRVLGLTAVKVAIGAGVAVAGTGGLAAADQLPDPVQDAVSKVASWVGVDLPAPAVEHMPDEFPGKGRDGFPGRGHTDDVGRPDDPGEQGSRPDAPGQQGGQPDDPGEQGSQPDEPGQQGEDNRVDPELPSRAPGPQGP